MKDIVIVGAGGFGREVAWLIERINEVNAEWNLLGFVDDNEEVLGTEVNGYKVLGNIDWLNKQELNVATAIGDSNVRKSIIKRLKNSRNIYPVLIDPNAICSNEITYGEGVIVCAGTVITVNVKVGNHVIINLDCTIGHDAALGDYTTILPSVNISGYVVTEECVNIGTSSAVIPGKSIGEGTIVGAGSVVVKDLPANCTAVGAPAKPIKFHESV